MSEKNYDDSSEEQDNYHKLSDEELEKLLKRKKMIEAMERYSFLQKIKRYLLYYYSPVAEAKDAEFHFTTDEICNQLLNVFPTPLLTVEEVAVWMNEGGFKFYDFGEMRFEWLMKKA